MSPNDLLKSLDALTYNELLTEFAKREFYNVVWGIDQGVAQVPVAIIWFEFGFRVFKHLGWSNDDILDVYVQAMHEYGFDDPEYYKPEFMWDVWKGMVERYGSESN